MEIAADMAAVSAAGIDPGCVDCFTARQACVGSSCTVCANSGCPCDQCQCLADCPYEFSTCSGLDDRLTCVGSDANVPGCRGVRDDIVVECDPTACE